MVISLWLFLADAAVHARRAACCAATRWHAAPSRPRCISGWSTRARATRGRASASALARRRSPRPRSGPGARHRRPPRPRWPGGGARCCFAAEWRRGARAREPRVAAGADAAPASRRCPRGRLSGGMSRWQRQAAAPARSTRPHRRLALPRLPVRFEGDIPPERAGGVPAPLPLLLAGAPRRARLLRDPPLVVPPVRVPRGRAARRRRRSCGTAVFVAVFYFLQRAARGRQPGAAALDHRDRVPAHHQPSSAPCASRPGWPRSGSTDRVPHRRRASRTLIVGAGSAGELLLRDLQRSRRAPLPRRRLRRRRSPEAGHVHRRPPGAGRPRGRCRRWCAALDVRQLLFAIPRLPAARAARGPRAPARDLKLTYKILPVSFAYLNDRVSVSMLQDLAPTTCCRASRCASTPREMRGRCVTGRRILVTGAGGLHRQRDLPAGRGAARPSALVLVDTNENALYLLYRELQARLSRGWRSRRGGGRPRPPAAARLGAAVPPAGRLPRRRAQTRAASWRRRRKRRSRPTSPAAATWPPWRTEVGRRALRAHLHRQGGRARRASWARPSASPS